MTESGFVAVRHQVTGLQQKPFCKAIMKALLAGGLNYKLAGESAMHRSSILTCVFAGLLLSLASASAQEMAKLSELVSGMPKGEKQQIRVLTATLEPGDKTVFHTHRFPVTLYILEGAFTLELEGRSPVTIRAGEAMVEPPNVKMTGYNRSTTEPMRVITFYVSDPDTPFLDPIR